MSGVTKIEFDPITPDNFITARITTIVELDLIAELTGVVDDSKRWVSAPTQGMLRRRWWLRSRQIQSVQTEDGWSAASEFYVPVWAWPLEWLHRLAFGRADIAAVA